MSDDILAQRRMALEQAFHQRDRELLARLRESLTEEKQQTQQQQRLREVSGIRDQQVLDRLIRLHISPETFAALSLVPLVQVAWADRKVQDRERAAILQAAEANGIEENSAARQMLDDWLESPPSAELVGTWKDYVQALVQNASAEDRQTLRDSIMERARHVAEAAGGILGLGGVAASEREVLDDLARAFDI